MMSFMMVVKMILFVVSSGTLFSEMFRRNKFLFTLAGMMTLTSGVFLFRDICDEFNSCNDMDIIGIFRDTPDDREFGVEVKETEVKIDVSQAVNLAMNGDFSGYFAPKIVKDEFENDVEFKTRLNFQQSQLVEGFNNQVKRGDKKYQVGVVHLGKYEANSEEFPATIEWQAKWVNQFFADFPQEQKGRMSISREEAKQLAKSGRDKPLFVLAVLTGEGVKIQGVGVIEDNQLFTVANESWGKVGVFQTGVFQDTLKDGGLAPKMVGIAAGSFQMGSNDYDNEKPVHTVTVSQFALGVYEVTVGEFRKFIDSSGYKTDAEKGNGWCGVSNKDWRNVGFSQEETHPVVCVSWNDAVAYTQWLSEQTGYDYRLPTEAEWEYAARAGSETKYWWGDESGSNRANCHNDYCKDSYENTSPVGSFEANGFGVYDTVGNVWEWTCSDYASYSDGSGAEQICSENTSNNKVLRGGSWYVLSDTARSAGRSNVSQGGTGLNVGFRILRTSL
jgi:formylglycine-generating enzyme required for sulfatase activity